MPPGAADDGVAHLNSGYGTRMSFGPPVTSQIIKNLMIANAAVFVAQLLIPQATALGVVTPERVWLHSEIWRPITYMWIHSIGGMPLHLMMNMFMLWMFGSQLAEHWGEKRFLRYYLTCGIGAGILIATLPFIPVLAGWSPMTEQLGLSTLGASGAVMGVVLAYSFTWPYQRIQLLFPPVAIKAIWLIPLLLVFEFSSGQDNVSHLGHLGGLLIGWIYLVREGETPEAPTLETFKHLYYRCTGRKPPPTIRKSSKAIRPRRKLSLKRRYERRLMRKKLRSVSGETHPKRDRNDNDRTDR